MKENCDVTVRVFKSGKHPITPYEKIFLNIAIIFLKKLDGSLPENPVNNRRVANAVTLKSTFRLP